MPGFGNLVQKAFYLGVGAVSYANEKAGEKLAELRVQAQKLADELVQRGELTAEEARKMVDDMVQQAQQQPNQPIEQPSPSTPSEPRRIEIISEDEEPASTEQQKADNLRQQVQALQDELRRLKRD